MGPKEILKLLYDFDKILGLGLKKVKLQTIPVVIMALVQRRESYRKNKQWEEADKIRKEILNKGYTVEDTKKGPEIQKIETHGQARGTPYL